MSFPACVPMAMILVWCCRAARAISKLGFASASHPWNLPWRPPSVSSWRAPAEATWPVPTGVTWEDWRALPIRTLTTHGQGLRSLGKDCGSSCGHCPCRTRVAAFGHAADSPAVGGCAGYYLPSFAHRQSIDRDYGPRSRPDLSKLDGTLAYSGALSPAGLEHHRSVAG